ncbi:DUF817 family protein [Aeribacillus pallidus]|uniref:DUF817 domain-containing protein n=1 Tax=Aeribacillus pallidus TaxID=33936 RepID=UPI003B5A2712
MFTIQKIQIEIIIRQFVKEKLELIMREEIKNFLEIEQADTSNMRNGYYQRNLDTQYGRIEGLLVPRDRNGEFQTQLFAPYQRHTGWLELELFKVHMGSWAYPEEGYSKIFGVPLYSGFMYASVASYLCQAWRRLKVELVKWPPFSVVVPLAAAIYLNFFTHHYWFDVRWWLIGLVMLVFWSSSVIYEVNGTRYRMPLVLSFLLIGFFIWIAENIATFFGAWQYPNQAKAWSIVHLGKVSSWFLLVIVSFLIVATLKQMKGNATSHKVQSITVNPLPKTE